MEAVQNRHNMEMMKKYYEPMVKEKIMRVNDKVNQ